MSKNIMELIQPMEVTRDVMGFWSHPGIPDFDEDHLAYKEWQHAQGLEICHQNLESEDDEHPAYKSYYEGDGGGSIAEWNPDMPEGDGWFVLSIHDTEDGPYYVWARRTA